MTYALHPEPGLSSVLVAQLRFVGVSLRRDAVMAAGLLAVLTVGLALSIRLNDLSINFVPELNIAFAMLGFFVPFAVWKGRDRSRDSHIWTAPVDHRQHALMRVLGGWIWLLVGVGVFLLWLIGLVLVTNGHLTISESRLLLDASQTGGVRDPATLQSVQWHTPGWAWLLPVTTATLTYLLGSSLALASEHPFRWIGAGFLLFFVAALGGEAGLGVLANSISLPFVHPYGLDTVITGGGPSLNTVAQGLDGTDFRVWRGLPSFGRWLIATLLWSGGACAVLLAATWRYRERRPVAKRRVARQVGVAAIVAGALVGGAPIAPPLAAQQPGAVAAAGVPHFPANERLIPQLRRFVESGRTRGLVIGLIEADGSTRVVVAGSGGNGGRPLSDSSLFEIGSITKTMTAALLADMAAKGEVSLSDPLSKHLPGVKVPGRSGREITLLDLATHYSGLPRMAAMNPADDSNPYADYTVPMMYDFVSRYELPRDPATNFEYSNLGYGLLGHALARRAGTTYADLVRQRILGPLGMSMTRYGFVGGSSLWITIGHDTAGNATSHWQVTEASAGAGGLVSSVRDMLTYLAANIGEARTPIEQAMRVAHEARRKADEREIGLAWLSRSVNGRSVVFHHGDTGGYHSLIAFDPHKQVGLVMLSNSDSQDGQLIAFAMGLLAPAVPDTTLRDVPIAGQDLERYAGTYAYVSNGTPRQLRVFREGNALMAQIVGGPTIALRHQGNHAFAAAVGPNTVRIVFNLENNKVNRIVIYQRGLQIAGERLPD